MEKIFVIGAGTMAQPAGRGVSNSTLEVLKQKGYEVIVRDIKDEFVDRGIAGINKGLTKLVSKGKITEEDKEAVLSKITGTTDLGLAADCDLVIEANFR